MRSLRLSLTTAIAMTALGGPGWAQMPMGMMGQNAPPISPYIGLLRTGASPGVNWANIVMPQMELYNAANQLQGQQNAFAAQGTMTNVPTTTGHPFAFGSFLQFYNSRGVLGSGMMGMGGMGMGGMGMGGMGMGGMGMGGMGMGGMGMGGMGMGGMGMGGMGMGGMGMGGMGMPMGNMGTGIGGSGMGGAGYTPPGR